MLVCFPPTKQPKKCSSLSAFGEQTLSKQFGDITNVRGNKILARFRKICGNTAKTFCCEKTSVLTAQSHLLVRQELDSLSRALNVNVLFLSNYDKYLNHKHFIPQFFLCWKRDRTEQQKESSNQLFWQHASRDMRQVFRKQNTGRIEMTIISIQILRRSPHFPVVKTLKNKIKA